MEGVENLPVHDAIIRSINLDWSASTLVLHLSAFIEKDREAKLCTLTFHGITDSSAPHKSPRGDSDSINGIKNELNRCSIEIQSGDKLQAKWYAFKSTNL
jgi:hypothetical protein